jgi:hypothetical protein
MFAGAVDSSVAAFVGRCNGSELLGDALSQLAAELGRSRNAFAPAFLAVVRRLIELGILLPAAESEVLS